MEDQGFAALIGLRYVEADETGILRKPWGRGFTFRWPDGSVVDEATRARCDALAIPPAWTEVWVCADDRGHLQARGQDAAGRTQYLYHDRWTEARRAANFDRLTRVGRLLKPVRRRIAQALESDDPLDIALAAMVRLVDHSLGRIGNEASALESGTRGISTLTSGHVERVDDETLQLRFVGKSAVEHASIVDDPRLVDVIAELDDVGGERLFSIALDGQHVSLTATDANKRLAEWSNGVLSCKDFRTWGGSAAALEARVRGARGPAVIDAAADALHNTRAVARSSYVHPSVLDATDSQVETSWRASRRSKWYARRERALLKLLSRMPPLLDAYSLTL
jgi:DNA topoisomerase-1